MKDNSFALAMGKIIDQAEAEQQQEARGQRRRQTFGRARGIFVFLFGATILVFAFCYRGELQNLLFAKTSAPSGGATASALKAARDNAAIRDGVVSDTAK